MTTEQLEARKILETFEGTVTEAWLEAHDALSALGLKDADVSPILRARDEGRKRVRLAFVRRLLADEGRS